MLQMVVVTMTRVYTDTNTCIEGVIHRKGEARGDVVVMLWSGCEVAEDICDALDARLVDAEDDCLNWLCYNEF